MKHIAVTKPQGVLRLLNDKRGNIMPIAAIGMIAMAGMVGGGVDISRAYMVQNRLQNACDSGVLAGRRAIGDNGFNTSAKNQAEDYFDTNFNQANEGTRNTSFVTTAAENNNRVNGVAKTTVDTVVMNLFGFSKLDLSVNCSASMSIGNSDVVMVLDTTGSMDWTLSGATTADDSQKRITHLKTAMKNFYDTVESSRTGTNARVRYGFVPYSTSANVGHLITDVSPAYLVENWTYQSREPQFTTEENQTLVGYESPVYSSETSYSDIDYGNWFYNSSTRYGKSKDCQDALPSNTAWTNDGGTSSSTLTEINSSGQRVTSTTVSQPQKRTIYDCYRQSRGQYYIIRQNQERDYNETDYAIEDPIYTTTSVSVFDKWEYKEVSYNVAAYRAGTSVNVPMGTDGANVATTWKGCVEEASTKEQDNFHYSKNSGLDPSDAYDLDIDLVPDASDDETRWRPLWPEVSYYRTTDSSGRYYSASPRSDYGTKTYAACPVEAQLLTEMSESEFDAYADSLQPEGSTYHDIGMIWGGRLSSPEGVFAANVTAAPANGSAVSRHIIFMTDGQMSTSSGAYTAYGVEWHDRRVTANGYADQNRRHSKRFLTVCEQAKAKGIRVWVIAFASALTTDLETCASTDSAFPAASASQLNSAFQEIAKNVGELRVVQ